MHFAWTSRFAVWLRIPNDVWLSKTRVGSWQSQTTNIQLMQPTVETLYFEPFCRGWRIHSAFSSVSAIHNVFFSFYPGEVCQTLWNKFMNDQVSLVWKQQSNSPESVWKVVLKQDEQASYRFIRERNYKINELQINVLYYCEYMPAAFRRHG